MSNDNNRVLIRKGARQLTQTEIEEVTGARLTVATALPTGTIKSPDEMFDQ
ncbi:MAG TPA: hypothetical protein VGK24_06560 [Candidatus Angelobacter sp.]|jgi:hypothetical protein